MPCYTVGNLKQSDRSDDRIRNMANSFSIQDIDINLSFLKWLCIFDLNAKKN